MTDVTVWTHKIESVRACSFTDTIEPLAVVRLDRSAFESGCDFYVRVEGVAQARKTARALLDAVDMVEAEIARRAGVVLALVTAAPDPEFETLRRQAEAMA